MTETNINNNDKKIKLLIIGIIMNCAGTEKSFLAFANNLDYSKYDVTLLLAKKEGKLIDKIPQQIKIKTMDQRYADLFLLSGANAAKTIWNCNIKHAPLTIFEILPYAVKMVINRSNRSGIATRLWCRMMSKMPELKEEYDVAAAYWGDRTMFYMCVKVKAKKKIAWLHFDYDNPPRDDKLYLSYFKKCDNIVTVSSRVNDALKNKLPQISDRCTVIENINDPITIDEMSKQGSSFDDDYKGTRILTVARICDQKGQDMAVDALKRLINDGYNVRWYFLGGGDSTDIEALKKRAEENGISDKIVLLGTTDNPYPYIKDCGIFALTSRYEGKPITVEEAKMMCKPILATKYVSAAEQLDSGKFGVLCDINEESIYYGLKKLLDSSDLRDEIVSNLKNEDFGNKSEIEKFYNMTK